MSSLSETAAKPEPLSAEELGYLSEMVHQPGMAERIQATIEAQAREIERLRAAISGLIRSRYGGWISALEKLDRLEAAYGEEIEDDNERTCYISAGDLRAARAALAGAGEG